MNSTPSRILGHATAREITVEEINDVSGGNRPIGIYTFTVVGSTTGGGTTSDDSNNDEWC